MTPVEEKLRRKIHEWKLRSVFAVWNSSPCIYLTRIGALDVCLRAYKKVYIPPGVESEVIKRGKEIGAVDAHLLESCVADGRIVVKEIAGRELHNAIAKNPFIHAADAEAIALASELKCVLVMDDPKGVEMAQMMNLQIEPTMTVILIAYSLSLIDFPAAENFLKELLQTRFRIGAGEYEKAKEYLHLIQKIKECVVPN